MKKHSKKRSRSFRISKTEGTSEKGKMISDETSEKGKMMSDENEEDSRVGLPVYKLFLKYLSGWRFLLYSQLCMIGFIIFKMLMDYQIGNWATSPD